MTLQSFHASDSESPFKISHNEAMTAIMSIKWGRGKDIRPNASHSTKRSSHPTLLYSIKTYKKLNLNLDAKQIWHFVCYSKLALAETDICLLNSQFILNKKKESIVLMVIFRTWVLDLLLGHPYLSMLQMSSPRYERVLLLGYSHLSTLQISQSWVWAERVLKSHID